MMTEAISPGGSPSADQPVLVVCLLGAFRVRVNGHDWGAALWPRRKAATLLKLLAVAPRQQLHRDQVYDALWPNLDPDAAANNLYGVLHALRRALRAYLPEAQAADYLRLQQQLVILGPHDRLWVDVAAFREAATTARRLQTPGAYETAIARYAGPLLPDDRYEEWATGLAETLHMLYTELLTERAELCESLGDPRAALRAWKALLAAEPTAEVAYRQLMRNLARQGERNRALLLYDCLRRMCRREYDAEPDDASRELYETILHQRPGMNSGTDPGHPVLPVRPLLRLVGRGRDLRELPHHLRRHRLVALTGPAGIGKTALARQLALEAADRYRDGVWLIDLMPVPQAELLPHAVAASLGVAERSRHLLPVTLAEHLRPKEVLLILDHCEASEPLRRLVTQLLQGAPAVEILTIGRGPLDLGGELPYPLPPLPPPDRATGGHEAEDAAAQLFTRRIAARRPGWGASPEVSRQIGALCRALADLPLAIILVAAQFTGQDFAAYARQLRQVLAESRTIGTWADGAPRIVPPLLSWWYDSLPAAARQLLRLCAHFADSWTLEAAAAVCRPAGDRAAAVEDLHRALHALGAIVAYERGAARRFSLPAITRTFLQAQSRATAETAAARDLHLTWCLALAEGTPPGPDRPAGPHSFAHLSDEQPNLRVALQWAIEGGRIEEGLRLGANLWRFWYTTRHLDEGRTWLEALLASAPPAGREEAGAAHLAEVLAGLSALAALQGDHAGAIAFRSQELDVRRQLGHAPTPADDGADEPGQQTLGELTPRENEVVALLERRYTNSQIAQRLGISRRTADAHVRNILLKLGLRSRLDVVDWAEARRAVNR